MPDAADPATPEDASDAALPQRIVAGAFAGSLLFALVTAVTIAVSVPMPLAGLKLRLLDHLFDATETLGVGLLGGLVAAGAVRFLRLRARLLPWVALALSAVLVWVVVGEYLELQAAHGRASRIAPLVLANFIFLSAGSLAAAPWIPSSFAGRPRLAWVPLAVAVVVMVGNEVPLRDDYFGIHGLVALGAAILAGSAMSRPVLRRFRAIHRPVVRRGGLVAALGVGLFGLAVPPPNDVRCELFRQPCAVAPWALASTLWRTPSPHAPVTLPDSPWRKDRSKDPPIPFTTPPPLPAAPVVVLITIDALRGDVFLDPQYDAEYPTLAAMKKDGVVFTHASSAATQTPVSLSTMFSGLYFSQQLWRNYGEGGDRYPYPAADTFPRVPELLTHHGVATVQESAYVFLAGPFGVCRGFAEEHVFGQTKAAAPAHLLVNALVERLEQAGDGPLFAYAHIAEPHAPYNAGRGATDYERYLGSIAVADAQLARVRDLLHKQFGDRWALIVSADHGESFGQHGTFEHAKTLYEELVHVPLVFESPHFTARRIDTRVGLVDMGPTLLDLFRLPTPATFDGQSLVPFLVGKDVALTRPLFAEGRLKRSYTEQDGFKVIVDPRRTTVEAYDLAVDPLETRNVFDREPARSDRALAELDAFFAARTRHDDGYVPPYKP